MHEVFLCRLANHPVFRNDHNFRVFLEYEQDVIVSKTIKNYRILSFKFHSNWDFFSSPFEGKTKRRNWRLSFDPSPRRRTRFCWPPPRRMWTSSLIRRRTFYWITIPCLRTLRSGRTRWPKLIKVLLLAKVHVPQVCKKRNLFITPADVADHFIKISSCLLEMATADTNQLERFATKAADIFEKARVKIQVE